MSRGHDIVCISSIDWDFIWQGHQQIMTALATNGSRVLFVENTGVRRPTLKDLPRLRHRIRNWWRGTKGFRKERENLFVYSPLILPFPYSRIARWINRAVLFRALRRWMLAVGFRRPLVWTFLPTPLARDLIREFNGELTIYYCIDDLASSSPPARRIARSESQLFREADLVFVTSEKLRERAARFRDRVHVFPFGVDFSEFERVRKGSDEIPADLRELDRPVLGYVGGMHQWVDQELLATVAEAMPEASFALIGPRQTDVSLLVGRPNVHLLGPRTHQEVPRYVKGFDVGLVPYRRSEYTANVYPTKLNEYLAMGIPVVATDLSEIRRFNAEYGEIVLVARDAATFAGALRQALEKRSCAEEVERRIEVAWLNSWDARITRMSELIEEALAASRAAGTSWEDALNRLYRIARRRIAQSVAALVALYFLLFYTPFVWFLAEPLRVVAPPRRVDAIVVVAGGVGESGKAGGGYQERVQQAVTLYHEGWAQRLIFSSGYVYAFREAEVMRDLAVAHGVPPSVIVLETKAANTYDNVRFVREILDAHGWREILLVSSPYHMRRILWTWRKVTQHISVVPTPAPRSQFYSHSWGASLEQIRGIIHEYAAIVAYWWRGWI